MKIFTNYPMFNFHFNRPLEVDQVDINIMSAHRLQLLCFKKMCSNSAWKKLRRWMTHHQSPSVTTWLQFGGKTLRMGTVLSSISGHHSSSHVLGTLQIKHENIDDGVTVDYKKGPKLWLCRYGCFPSTI